jgi:dienelactone hydrolase
VLGLYGEADTGIPVADVKAFEATLKAKGNPRQEAAEDAWRRCLSFFDQHLKAS